jgi:hypothetical protein
MHNQRLPGPAPACSPSRGFMIRRTLVVSWLAATAAAAPLRAQSTDQQLVAARDTVWRAFFHNDTALLRRFVPPAAASLEGPGGGRWNTRSAIMNGARSFVKGGSQLVDLQFANTQITMSGHTAIVRSNYTVITATGARADTTFGRASELFVRQGTTWINPYWQLEPGTVGAEREIPLPDTLGANFAIADSAQMLGTASDYDALLGTWTFRFQSRRADGTYWSPFAGHWTFEKLAGGGIIEDRWRPDDASIPMTQTLHTYRTFDPVRKVWQMFGSSPTGGEVQPGLTWSDANGRYAIQRNHGVLSRIRYLAIGADTFLWRTDTSTDGGRTWVLDTGIMEARRIGR